MKRRTPSGDLLRAHSLGGDLLVEMMPDHRERADPVEGRMCGEWEEGRNEDS
jgi:hypothetical protein